jgi:O-antigen ligase/peptidoglycan/xylan/chitin deacetylase (PgdA/CDA1 family)
MTRGDLDTARDAAPPGPPVDGPEAFQAPATARRLDAAGVALGGVFGLWILVTAVAGGSNPLPMLGTLVLAAGALLLARGAAVKHRPVGPPAVVALGAAAVLLGLGGLGGAAGAPLLYSNANAAFFVQAAAGGLMMAATWRSSAGRIAGFVAASGFAVLTAVTGSGAGILLLVGLAAAAALSWRGGVAVRAVTVAGAAALVGALVFTVVVAGGDLDRETRRQVAGGVTTARVRLWSEALGIVEENPVLGVGPGAFEVGSRTARTDRDIGWAHNDFLQQGAETGLPGLLLLVLVFLWGFARLWAAPPDTATGLAAAALAVLGVHASFDYVLHFPVLSIAAAALVGTAQASRDRRPDEARPGTLLRKALKAATIPVGLRSRTRPGDVSILLYHRVGRGGREIDLPADVFDRQIAALGSGGRVVGLGDALGDGGGGVVVTVDDGFRDFHEHVLPALVRHGVPAVLYLATGLVTEEGGPPDGLTWAHLLEAVATGLVTMGSHTHGHANLSNASEREAEEELRRSQGLVEDRLGVPCRHFAYPWGVGSAEADRAVRRLFDTAVLPWGTNRAGRIDRYRLARVPILRSDGPALFRAKVEGRLDGEAMIYRLLGRGPWRRP